MSSLNEAPYKDHSDANYKQSASPKLYMNLPQIGSRNHKSLPHLIPRQLSSDDYRRPATKRDEYKRRQQQDDWNKIVKADQIAHAVVIGVEVELV